VLAQKHRNTFSISFKHINHTGCRGQQVHSYYLVLTDLTIFLFNVPIVTSDCLIGEEHVQRYSHKSQRSEFRVQISENFEVSAGLLGKELSTSKIKMIIGIN